MFYVKYPSILLAKGGVLRRALRTDSYIYK
jgi:hypothetical protein